MRRLQHLVFIGALALSLVGSTGCMDIHVPNGAGAMADTSLGDAASDAGADVTLDAQDGQATLDSVSGGPGPVPNHVPTKK